jgi:hypothetical protein
MRSAKLVFLGIALSLFAAAALADSIDSVTPSSFFVNDAEVQITINGSGLQGNIESIVNFDGPGGHFIAATNGGASTFLVVSVPPGVLATVGHYLISVDAIDNTGTRHITGGALDILARPVGPPSIFVPDSIAADATSASGAVVMFTVAAINGDGSPAPFTCNGHNSGDLYPIGVTVVTCDVTDSFGTILRDGFGTPIAQGSFTIFVNNTGLPMLTLPANIVSMSQVVTFTATAVDHFGTPIPVHCSPASGSTFAFGNTTVQCTAIDSFANEAIGTFNVFVGSEPPPSLVLPANMTVEATSAAGAVVTFTATTDPGVSLVCTPASGSQFPLGLTTVQCTATKSALVTTTGSFKVNVVDTTPPVLTVPADFFVEATSAAGAVVTYTVTATDAVSVVTPHCDTPSGSLFPFGTTTVTCFATDFANNATQKSFNVTVRDTTPPTVTSITASPSTLWPPDHKMVPITVTVIATDTVDSNPTSTIVSVSSNQPINGTGDGNTSPDWVITGPLTLNLRAERSHGTDRVYTITVATSDFSGNTTTSTVTVTVTQGAKSRSVGH